MLSPPLRYPRFNSDSQTTADIKYFEGQILYTLNLPEILGKTSIPVAAWIEYDSIKQREVRALFETENGTERGYVRLYNGSKKNIPAFK